MWTATLDKVERRGYMLHASYTLTSGDGEVISDTTFADDMTKDRLAAVVQARIESLEARDLAYADMSKAVGAAIALPRDAAPTQKEQAADAFFVLLGELNALRLRVEKGLLKADDASVIAKTVEVKAAYLPEYEKDRRYG
jgi:hypothetical protein